MTVPLQAGGKTLSPVPGAGWPSVLGESAKEVFSMMAGMEVVISADNSLPVLANVTGVIGIGGAFSGVFTLRCSTLSAAKIASQMLGVSPEEAGAQSADAIGEICNMVAGQFKAKIGYEASCMLSLPTVVTGKQYTVHTSQCTPIQMPLLYDGEPIWISLEIRE